jgi:hypothetical protein
MQAWQLFRWTVGVIVALAIAHVLAQVARPTESPAHAIRNHGQNLMKGFEGASHALTGP